MKEKEWQKEFQDRVWLCKDKKVICVEAIVIV